MQQDRVKTLDLTQKAKKKRCNRARNPLNIASIQFKQLW